MTSAVACPHCRERHSPSRSPEYMCFSAKDKAEKKLFGFSFIPLMQEDGLTLPDGTHELIVHKVTTATRGWGRRGRMV